MLVKGKLLRPDGTPYPPAELGVVQINLVAAPNTDGQGFYGAVGGEIVGRQLARPDGNGDWQIDAVPNDAITPANTYYRVIESAGGMTMPPLYIQVPTSGTSWWIYDILYAPPVDLPVPTLPAERPTVYADLSRGTEYGETGYVASRAASWDQPVRLLSTAAGLLPADSFGYHTGRIVGTPGPVFDPSASPSTWPAGAQAQEITTQQLIHGVGVELLFPGAQRFAGGNGAVESNARVSHLLYTTGNPAGLQGVSGLLLEGFGNTVRGLLVRNKATNGDGLELAGTGGYGYRDVVDRAGGWACARDGLVIRNNQCDQIVMYQPLCSFNGRYGYVVTSETGNPEPNAITIFGGKIGHNGDPVAGTGAQVCYLYLSGTPGPGQGYNHAFIGTKLEGKRPAFHSYGGHGVWFQGYIEIETLATGDAQRSMVIESFQNPAGAGEGFWSRDWTIAAGTVIRQVDDPTSAGPLGAWATGKPLWFDLNYFKKLVVEEGVTMEAAFTAKNAPSANNKLMRRTANTKRCHVNWNLYDLVGSPSTPQEFSSASLSTIVDDAGTRNRDEFVLAAL